MLIFDVKDDPNLARSVEDVLDDIKRYKKNAKKVEAVLNKLDFRKLKSLMDTFPDTVKRNLGSQHNYALSEYKEAIRTLDLFKAGLIKLEARWNKLKR